ncbi:MAG: hypothetical protein ACR2G3_12555 [Solirubrobacterales bacterium]
MATKWQPRAPARVLLPLALPVLCDYGFRVTYGTEGFGLLGVSFKNVVVGASVAVLGSGAAIAMAGGFAGPDYIFTTTDEASHFVSLTDKVGESSFLAAVDEVGTIQLVCHKTLDGPTPEVVARLNKVGSRFYSSEISDAFSGVRTSKVRKVSQKPVVTAFDRELPLDLTVTDPDAKAGLRLVFTGVERRLSTTTREPRHCEWLIEREDFETEPAQTIP